MKQLEPNITIEDIEIKINNDADAYDGITEAWGPQIPVMKINEYVLSPGEIRRYEFNVKINQLPSFFIEVDDTDYSIRKTLESEYIDLVTVFVGFKNWYHKYQGIITEIYSDAGETRIIIQGTLYIPKLFETVQQSYNDKSITDILKDICSKTDIGLYTIDNDDIQTPISTINDNKKHVSFINDVIRRHTDNVWCIDNFYYLHIGDIETIKNQDIDTFTLKNGVVADPQPIRLVANPYMKEEDVDIDKTGNELPYFKVKFYTINTNIGDSYINSYGNYSLNGGDGSKKDLYNQNVNRGVGLGELSTNTFSGFMNTHKNTETVYKNIANKTLNDKVIEVIMQDVVYEITPFMNIDLELYLPLNFDNVDDYGNKMDTENSGKKTIIGYSMLFDMESSESNPIITQKINLI